MQTYNSVAIISRNRKAPCNIYAGLVTGGGTAVFLESDADAYTLPCIANAEKLITTLETAGFPDVAASETIRLAEVCGVSPERLER